MSKDKSQNAWVALMVEPRGGLLDGEHALVINRAVFPTKKAAQERADEQAAFEANFPSRKGVRFIVANVSPAA